MTEKATNNIPVEPFRPDIDDFDEWIALFESGVVLATNATGDRRAALFKEWLPIKLDDQTRMILRTCTKTTWSELKEELKGLLVDPQAKYNWRSGRLRIIWDGRESFHIYGMRVKRAVDKYEDPPRESDYFHCFRKGLPENYMEAIDLGVSAETLEEAKRVAIRYQTSQSGKSPTGAPAPVKAVSFTGASMSDDRLKSIELTLQGMSVKMDNFESGMKKLTTRVDGWDDRLRRSPSRSEYEPRGRDSSPGRNRGGDLDNRRRDSSDSRGSPNRRDRPDSRDRRDSSNRRDNRDRRDDRERRDSQDRYRSYDDRRPNDRRFDRSNSQVRSRRDSFDRRNNYDRRDSYERRDSYDRRDFNRRYGDRSRNGSWDQRPDSRSGRYASGDRGHNRDDRNYQNFRSSPARQGNGDYLRDSRNREYGRENRQRDEYNNAEIDEQLRLLCATMLEKNKVTEN